jgi:hypothetical protein
LFSFKTITSLRGTVRLQELTLRKHHIFQFVPDVIVLYEIKYQIKHNDISVAFEIIPDGWACGKRFMVGAH